MSSSAQPMDQLLRAGLATLTQVVFDNIEEGRYYYVREREPGETFYDLYGRVSDKTGSVVTLDVLFKRSIVATNEGEWEAVGDDDDASRYRAERDLVNSVEQEMSARFYLPQDAA